MPEIYELISVGNADSNYLSAVRNGFILMIVAVALLALKNEFSRYAPIVFAIVIILLAVATYQYWESGSKSITLISYVVIIVIVLCGIFISESLSR